MDKLKFVSVNYWNKATMNLGDSPTKVQWAEVESVCNTLNAKYHFESGCNVHPENIQKFSVGIFNGLIDIQIQKSDTCQCYKMLERMGEIRNNESETLNQQR
jgi:hypothetical protein